MTVTSTTCHRTSPGLWAITVRWAATGGRYTDLGSPGAWTRTPVTGGTRTRRATTSIGGWAGVPGPVPAPQSVTLGWGELIAPPAWDGNPVREQYWTGSPVTIPVRCA